MKLSEIANDKIEEARAWLNTYAPDTWVRNDQLKNMNNEIVLDDEYLTVEIHPSDSWVNPPFKMMIRSLSINLDHNVDLHKMNFDFLKQCDNIEIYNENGIAKIGDFASFIDKFNHVHLFSCNATTPSYSINNVVAALALPMGIDVMFSDLENISIHKPGKLEVFTIRSTGAHIMETFTDLFDLQDYLVNHGLEGVV